MKKWNMIIDVAECTNCQLCTLVGHGRIRRQRMAGRRRADAAARPPLDRHHAEGARAGADDRHRLRADHVQPLRRRALHEGRQARRDQQARRRHRHHRSGEGQGPQGAGRGLPLRPHLVERGIAAAAGLAVRRPSARPGLAADPRPAGLPDRRDARDQGRGRRDGAHGARRRPRGDEARGSAPSRASTTATSGATRKCFIGGSVSTEANGVVDCVEGATVRLLKNGADGRRAPPPTTTATSSSTGSTRAPAATPSKSPASAGPRRSKPSSAPASTSAKSGCSRSSRTYSSSFPSSFRAPGMTAVRLAPGRNPMYPCNQRAGLLRRMARNDASQRKRHGLDHPDPRRDLHRPRDQRLSAGRILISLPLPA